MKNKKAIFFDIDGTLISGKIGIPDSTINVLTELSNNPNFDLYISTGRGICTLNEVKPLLKYFNGLVLTNGQSLFFEGKNIHNNFLDKKIATDFINYCVDNTYSLGIILPEEIYMNFYDKVAENNFLTYCKADYTPFYEFKDYDKITQFWLFVGNSDIEKISKVFPSLSFLKWGKYGADVIFSNTGKGDGIRKVIEIMDYDFNNTYAFGDGENDVSMFKAVKYSIAMGNGCDYAKDNATYITDRIENDGLANAINKYILNKK